MSGFQRQHREFSQIANSLDLYVYAQDDACHQIWDLEGMCYILGDKWPYKPVCFLHSMQYKVGRGFPAKEQGMGMPLCNWKMVLGYSLYCWSMPHNSLRTTLLCKGMQSMHFLGIPPAGIITPCTDCTDGYRFLPLYRLPPHTYLKHSVLHLFLFRYWFDVLKSCGQCEPVWDLLSSAQLCFFVTCGSDCAYACLYKVLQMLRFIKEGNS